MIFKNSMISVVLASMLVGCGGSSNSPTQPPTPTPTPKSIICLDVNMNAICDTGETSEEVTAWDETNPVIVPASLKGEPLAYNGENGYIFTAPADFPKIYAGTTMLNNELIYNRVIDSKTKAEAKAYVHNKLTGDPAGDVSVEQKKDMADNFKANIEANSDASRYAVIAAVMNKAMMNPDNIKNITVSAADIAAAGVPSTADLNVTGAYDVNSTLIRAEQPSHWADPTHLRVAKISARNGVLVGGTYRHNGLIVVDPAKDGSFKFSNFSTLTDAGDDLPSVSTPSAPDTNSGASEPALNSVTLTSDGTSVYYNVPERGEASNKQTTGLFKASIATDGSIATATTALAGGDGTIISSTGARLDLKISNYALANDDSKVIIYDAEGILRLYDANLENAIARDDADVDNISAIAVSATTAYTATSGSTKITKRGTSDLSPSGDMIEVGFAADEMIINDDATIMFAFTHGHNYGGVTSLALIDLATDTVIDSGEVAFESDSAAISPDFTRAALFGHESDSIDIVNLTVSGFAVQKKIDASARTAAFVTNDSLAISNRNSIDVFDISLTTDNNTLEEEMVAAKESLTENAINGSPLNLIIKDLTLSLTYSTIGINWTNTLPTGVLNNLTGEVIRPVYGQADVTGGTLDAALSGVFRDVTLNENVPFTGLTVRAMPKVVDPSKKSDVVTGRSTYFAANIDGSVAVGPIRDANDIYSMASYTVDAAGQIAIATAPTRINVKDEIVGAGVVGDFAIFVAENKDDITERRIYSIAIAADGTLATTITSEVQITTGEPRKIEWTADNTKAVVEVRKDNDDEVAEIYSVAIDGIITLSATYDMGAGNAYADHGPMAANDDASIVYQKSDDRKKVVAIKADGTIIDTDQSFSKIARLWYAHGFLFVHDYAGNIHTLNGDTLEKLHEYNTGTGGRMYGGEGRTIDGKNYYIIPVQQSTKSTNGIYVHEVATDGSLKEVLFTSVPEGADRMAVSTDGKRVFYGYSDEVGERHIGVVTIDPAIDL